MSYTGLPIRKSSSYLMFPRMGGGQRLRDGNSFEDRMSSTPPHFAHSAAIPADTTAHLEEHDNQDISELILFTKSIKFFSAGERIQWQLNRLFSKVYAFDEFNSRNTIAACISFARNLLNDYRTYLDRTQIEEDNNNTNGNIFNLNAASFISDGHSSMSSSPTTLVTPFQPAIGDDDSSTNNNLKPLSSFTFPTGLRAATPSVLSSSPASPPFTGGLLQEHKRDRVGGVLTPNTKIYHLFAKYRVVFSLDISPSLGAMDPNTGDVLFDRMYTALEQCISALTIPISVPGGLEVTPEVMITVIAQGSFEKPLFTVMQGVLVTSDTLGDILIKLKRKLREIENMAAAALESETESNNGSWSPSEISYMIHNSIAAMEFLPDDGCPVIVLMTDGVCVLPTNAFNYEGILLKMNRLDISFTIVNIVGKDAVDYLYGYIPDTELLLSVVSSVRGTLIDWSFFEERGIDDLIEDRPTRSQFREEESAGSPITFTNFGSLRKYSPDSSRQFSLLEEEANADDNFCPSSLPAFAIQRKKKSHTVGSSAKPKLPRSASSQTIYELGQQNSSAPNALSAHDMLVRRQANREAYLQRVLFYRHSPVQVTSPDVLPEFSTLQDAFGIGGIPQQPGNFNSSWRDEAKYMSSIYDLEEAVVIESEKVKEYKIEKVEVINLLNMRIKEGFRITDIFYSNVNLYDQLDMASTSASSHDTSLMRIPDTIFMRLKWQQNVEIEYALQITDEQATNNSGAEANYDSQSGSSDSSTPNPGKLNKKSLGKAKLGSASGGSIKASHIDENNLINEMTKLGNSSIMAGKVLSVEIVLNAPRFFLEQFSCSKQKQKLRTAQLPSIIYKLQSFIHSIVTTDNVAMQFSAIAREGLSTTSSFTNWKLSDQGPDQDARFLRKKSYDYLSRPSTSLGAMLTALREMSEKDTLWERWLECQSLLVIISPEDKSSQTEMSINRLLAKQSHAHSRGMHETLSSTQKKSSQILEHLCAMWSTLSIKEDLYIKFLPVDETSEFDTDVMHSPTTPQENMKKSASFSDLSAPTTDTGHPHTQMPFISSGGFCLLQLLWRSHCVVELSFKFFSVPSRLRFKTMRQLSDEIDGSSGVPMRTVSDDASLHHSSASPNPKTSSSILNITFKPNVGKILDKLPRINGGDTLMDQQKQYKELLFFLRPHLASYLTHKRWIWIMENERIKLNLLLEVVFKCRLAEGFKIVSIRNSTAIFFKEFSLHRARLSSGGTLTRSESVDQLNSSDMSDTSSNNSKTSSKARAQEERCGLFYSVNVIGNSNHMITEFWVEPQAGYIMVTEDLKKVDEEAIYQSLVNWFNTIDSDILSSFWTFYKIFECKRHTSDENPPLLHNNREDTNESIKDVVYLSFDLRGLCNRGRRDLIKFNTYALPSSSYAPAATEAPPASNTRRKEVGKQGQPTEASTSNPNINLYKRLVNFVRLSNDVEIPLKDGEWNWESIHSSFSGCRCFARITEDRKVVLTFLPKTIQIGGPSLLTNTAPSHKSKSTPNKKSTIPSSTSLSNLKDEFPDNFCLEVFEFSENDLTSLAYLRTPEDNLYKKLFNQLIYSKKREAANISNRNTNTDPDMLEEDISSSSYQYCDFLQQMHRCSFAYGVFNSLQKKEPVTIDDFATAIDACVEYCIEVDLTEFMEVFKRLRRSKRISASERAKLKEELNEYFHKIIHQHFQLVPGTDSDKFYYLLPDAPPTPQPAADAKKAKAKAQSDTETDKDDDELCMVESNTNTAEEDTDYDVEDTGAKESTGDGTESEYDAKFSFFENDLEDYLSETSASSSFSGHGEFDAFIESNGGVTLPAFLRMECAYKYHDDDDTIGLGGVPHAGRSIGNSSTSGVGLNDHFSTSITFPVKGFPGLSQLEGDDDDEKPTGSNKNETPFSSPYSGFSSDLGSIKSQSAEQPPSKVILRLICVSVPPDKFMASINGFQPQKKEIMDMLFNQHDGNRYNWAKSRFYKTEKEKSLTGIQSISSFLTTRRLPKQIRHLLSKTRRRLQALVSREIMNSLLRLSPITRTTVEKVFHHVRNLPSSLYQRYSIPLEFIETKEGQDIFPSELEKFKYKDIVIRRIGQYYIVLFRKRKNQTWYYSQQQQQQQQQAFESESEASDLDDVAAAKSKRLTTGYSAAAAAESKRIVESSSNDPPCSYADHDANADSDDSNANDAPEPEEEEVEEVLNLDDHHNLVIPYWIILTVRFNVVSVLFYSPFPITKAKRSEVTAVIQGGVDQVCDRVNKLILLNQLHDTRVCSNYLIPPTERDIQIYGNTGDSPSYSSSPSSFDEVLKERSFREGQFACPKVYSISFPLHDRVQIGLALRTLSQSVFHSFLVTNRVNVFVYRERTGRVFYLRLFEGSASSSTNTSTTTPSSASSGVAARTAKSKSDSLYLSLFKYNPKPLNYIVLEVFGVDPPSPEITEQMQALLENKLSAMTLSILSSLLARNPMFKLNPEDFEFIRPSYKDPDKQFAVQIPSVVRHPFLFLLIMRQNLLSYLCRLYITKSHDETSSIASAEETDDDDDTTVCDDEILEFKPIHFSFLYNHIPTMYSNASSLASAVGKGIAFIHISVVDPATGQQVKYFPRHREEVHHRRDDAENAAGDASWNDVTPLDLSEVNFQHPPQSEASDASKDTISSSTPVAAASKQSVPVTDESMAATTNSNADTSTKKDDDLDEACNSEAVGGDSAAMSADNFPQLKGFTLIFSIWGKGDIEPNSLVNRIVGSVNQALCDYALEALLLPRPIKLPNYKESFLSAVDEVFVRGTVLGSPSIKKLRHKTTVMPLWAMEGFVKEVRSLLTQMNRMINPAILYTTDAAAEQFGLFRTDGPSVPFRDVIGSNSVAFSVIGGRLTLVVSENEPVMELDTIASSPSSMSLPRAQPTPSKRHGSGNSITLTRTNSSGALSTSSVISTTTGTATATATTNSAVSSMTTGFSSHAVLYPDITYGKSNFRFNRNCVIYINITALDVVVMAYNWRPAFIDQLNYNLKRFLSWTRCRVHLLNTIFHQKMGLFYHYTSSSSFALLNEPSSQAAQQTQQQQQPSDIRLTLNNIDCLINSVAPPTAITAATVIPTPTPQPIPAERSISATAAASMAAARYRGKGQKPAVSALSEALANKRALEQQQQQQQQQKQRQLMMNKKQPGAANALLQQQNKVDIPKKRFGSLLKGIFYNDLVEQQLHQQQLMAPSSSLSPPTTAAAAQILLPSPATSTSTALVFYDPVRSHGLRFKDTVMYYHRQNVEQNNLAAIYMSWNNALGGHHVHHAPQRMMQLMGIHFQTIMKTSRLFHMCRVPLFFNSLSDIIFASPEAYSKLRPSLRASTHPISSGGTASDSTSGASASPTQVDNAREIALHRHLLENFLFEYIEYLKTMGINVVAVADESQELQYAQQSKQGSSQQQQQQQPYLKRKLPRALVKISMGEIVTLKPIVIYLQKVIDGGGVLLIELGFDEVFIYLNVYVCDSRDESVAGVGGVNGSTYTNGSPFGSLSSSPHQPNLYGSSGPGSGSANSFFNRVNNTRKAFLGKVAMLQDKLHLNSFVYDFHLRHFQQFLLQRQFEYPVIDIISVVKDFLRFHAEPPSYARNILCERKVHISLSSGEDEGSQLPQSISGRDFFDYLCQHSERYGLRNLEFRGIEQAIILQTEVEVGKSNSTDAFTVCAIAILDSDLQLDNNNNNNGNNSDYGHHIMMVDTNTICIAMYNICVNNSNSLPLSRTNQDLLDLTKLAGGHAHDDNDNKSNNPTLNALSSMILELEDRLTQAIALAKIDYKLDTLWHHLLSFTITERDFDMLSRMCFRRPIEDLDPSLRVFSESPYAPWGKVIDKLQEVYENNSGVLKRTFTTTTTTTTATTTTTTTPTATATTPSGVGATLAEQPVVNMIIGCKEDKDLILDLEYWMRQNRVKISLWRRQYYNEEGDSFYNNNNNYHHHIVSTANNNNNNNNEEEDSNNSGSNGLPFVSEMEKEFVSDFVNTVTHLLWRLCMTDLS